MLIGATISPIVGKVAKVKSEERADAVYRVKYQGGFSVGADYFCRCGELLGDELAVCDSHQCSKCGTVCWIGDGSARRREWKAAIMKGFC